MTVAEIEKAIQQLSAEDFSSLMFRIAEYRNEKWDRQIGEDYRDGRLKAQESVINSSLFHCTAPDPLAKRLIVLLCLIVVAPYLSIIFPLFTKIVMAYSSIIAIIVLIFLFHENSLNSKITVTKEYVSIIKRFFIVPYKKYTAQEIELVVFDDESGPEEKPYGVIVCMGDKQICIGNADTAQFLYNNLNKFTKSNKRMKDSMYDR